jgi:Carboxypeptidase regulatory-like domain
MAAVLGLLAQSPRLWAQAQPDPSPPNPSPVAGDAGSTTPANLTRTVVQGVVKNAATGEPLPRALVRIEGDAMGGALTDGDGRFEISGVPTGPQAFQVIKPGFVDQLPSGMVMPATIVNGSSNSEHNVHVAVDMPDLVFNLSPTNAIRGQISLSTGDPAQGIGVMLLRRTVQEGRAVWQTATNARTNSDGAYRFAGLADGVYAIYTEPAMDNDVPANLVETGNDRSVTRWGYPSLFFPDASDLAGAAKIQVSGGQQAQANVLLTEEPFHLVRAAVIAPGGGSPTATEMNVTVTIQDGQGHQLPYGGQYDPATRSVQAFLPDGAYALMVTAIGGHEPIQFGPARNPRPNAPQGPLIGQLDFSVAGHAVTGLQVPLGAQRSSSVQLSMLRSGLQDAAADGFQGNPLVVMVSQAGGWITDGMVSSYAEGYATGPIETTYMGPGTYWVHTTIPQKGVCEGSFTAGGASLAREPLVISPSGATPPLTLTLRDDCSSLWVSLPPTAETPEAGEEPSYTVYVIPDFDSTADIAPITLRPSSGGMFALSGLTPGPYKVFTFPSPVELEYRNPEALAALSSPGQAVTLAPNATGHVEVEVPGH